MVTVVVEDGSIISGANSYVSVADFFAWHGDRGIEMGTITDDAAASAVIRATDYVDKRFGTRFVGKPREREQSLSWPRYNAISNQGEYIESEDIPKEVKRAVLEYALIAARLGELLPVPAPSFNPVNTETGETTISKGGMVQRERSRVGPIEEEVWYNQEQWRLILNGRASGVMSGMSSAFNLPEYPVADEWLNNVVRTSGSTRLERG